MDSLQIKALSVNTRVGVYEWEQRINQRLLLDITIPSDFSQCTDKLVDMVDYARLCQLVTEFVESNHYQLIESVANQVAQFIKTEFNVAEVTVSVSKGQVVSNVADVRVSVTR